jgi:hypothetical protein
MVKKVSFTKEARTKEGRKKIREKLGTLKSLTVQDKTKARYKASLDDFFSYLRAEGLQLPTKREFMDDLISDYLEYLWAQGEGRAVGSTFLAALQDHDPKLKHNLPSSWRLMKTWTTHEVPCRAPPLSEPVLKALVGWAIMQQHETFALSLLVGFYGLLRTGELLAIQAWQIHMVSPTQPAVINLGLTKTGKRQGAAESVTLTEKNVLSKLWAWKNVVPPHTFLTLKPHAWRDLFSEALKKLKLEQWKFRPYSLRRGGATHLFTKNGSLDRVLIAGRWTALKTARIYINSGLAMLSDIQIPKSLLSPFHHIFHTWISQPSLEPVAPKRAYRTGGRGKGHKVHKMKGGGRVVV